MWQVRPCYIRRYEENTGPHHQKIRAKDRRRDGKARAKSENLRVGIGPFLNSRLGASARQRAQAPRIAEWVDQQTKGVCWDDPTTETNAGRVATAQPLSNWSTGFTRLPLGESSDNLLFQIEEWHDFETDWA
jgi:hypothetical protein